MTSQAAWERAEAISAERLIDVIQLDSGAGYVARFTTDQGLRCFGQSLIQHGNRSVGILILPDGTIPREREARLILQPHLAKQEEITVTVKLTFSCPIEASQSEQSDMIHTDLTRLLDYDSTSGAECSGFIIKHVAPEAETYGNVEPSNVPAIQAERIGDGLAAIYTDTDNKGEQLRAALCDLRHFADANGLDFSLWDKSAVTHYNAEADQ